MSNGMKCTGWILLGFLLATLAAPAQTNVVAVSPPPGVLTNTAPAAARVAVERQRAQRAGQIRAACLAGARHICGRVVQILPHGLVVASGYTNLLDPHYVRLWRVPGTAAIAPRLAPVEPDTPGAPCVGLVYLTDLPKRPAVRLYDYVTLHAYPAGTHAWVPVPGVTKTLRQFAVRLSTAVRLNLESNP
jgi:hypothetical protein